MAQRPKWLKMLDASKSEAVLATKLYNEPEGPRSLEGFVVHMNLAWLYLCQAEWTKNKVDYRIPDPSRKGRYIKVDDEHKVRELGWFVKEKWDDNSAIRANIEFFIRLRNKIEHRHNGDNKSLATVISGECHAFLLNYEEALVALGGQQQSLSHVLHFPVFIGGFTDKGKDALVKLTNHLPADLRTFLAEYDQALDESVSRDPRYCLRLSVYLEKGNRKGDLSIQFFNPDDLSPDELAVLEQVAQRGYVINRNKQIPVSNLENMKASRVVAKVAAAIPYTFKMHHFTAAYKIGKFRPPNNSSQPHETRSDFCIYDQPHNDYTYTPAYLKFLIKKCSTANGFLATTGIAAVPKDVVNVDKP